jgi:potassium intermediate/small conductance calcium-activated channel subfamily N protein 2
LDGKIQYDSYINGIWNIIVAVTTVGYGDFYPKSHIGRFILVTAVILGTVIISLTIVALNGIISFDENEKDAYQILDKIYFRKDLNDVCQKIIYYNYRIKLIKNSFESNILNEKPEYSHSLKKLKKQSGIKVVLMKKINEFCQNKDKERFFYLEENINNCFVGIKKDLEALKVFKRKITSGNKNRILLTSNIQKTLSITRD